LLPLHLRASLENENTKRSKVIIAVGEAAASATLIPCEITAECIVVGGTARQGVSGRQCFMQAEDKIGVREDNGGAVQGRKERSLVTEVAFDSLDSFFG
jgi:hypothetical protein